MAHFTPTYKFSNDKILVGSYSEMSENDQIIRSLQQNNIVNSELLNAIIKSSESQFKTKLKSDRELAGNSIAVLSEMVKSNQNLQESLEDSFNMLYNHLSGVSAEMDIFHTAMIEQYRISNATLEELAEYIKIPEFEKERLFHIKTGLGFLKQVFIEPARYSDALDYFLKANVLNNRDYIVLNQIGLIYLYGEDLIDFKKAENFLKRAFDYAFSADKATEASHIAKHLAYTYLLMGQFENAIKYADKGLVLNNSITELEYIKAESLMLLGKSKEGVNALYELAIKDAGYVSEAIANKNFKTTEFDNFIVFFRKNITNNIDKITFSIEKNMIDGSEYHDKFVTANTSISVPSPSTISLINAFNEFKNILDLVKMEGKGKNNEYIRIKEEIEKNEAFLTETQYEELLKALEVDAYKAEAMFEMYFNANLSETEAIVDKAFNHRKRFIIWSSNLPLIIGLIFTINSIFNYLAHGNIELVGNHNLNIGVIALVIAYFWNNELTKRTLYGEAQKQIAKWSMIGIVCFYVIFFFV